MAFVLRYSKEAHRILTELERDPTYAKKLKKIRRALAHLERDPRHPGLHVHKYESLTGPLKQSVFEAYVENNTPSAWRIWFWYGPNEGEITVLTIGPHPD